MHPEDGRLRHYRDFYRPAASSSAKNRPLWLVWGNCQAEALRQVLHVVPGRPYRTARVPPVHELRRSDLPYLDALLKQTDVLLTQPVRSNYREMPIGVADLRDRLPKSSRVVRWPVIRYAGLYPFQAIARDPSDRSITPPGAPYHDLRTVAAARARRRPVDPWDVDICPEQIRAVASASLDDLARRERRDSDIGVSDVLVSHGANASHTINHPGNPVLRDLAMRILDALNVRSRPAPIADPLLDSAWAPLESRVLEALGIAAPVRSRWRLDGVAVEPDEIHTLQLRWYQNHSNFIELVERRHQVTMRTLGLLGSSQRL